MVKSINGLFEQDFLCIKDRAQKETITSDQLITPEESVSHSIHTNEDQTEQRDPSSINQTKDPHSHCYCTDMRERFTELEGEMVQLKEMIFSLQKVQTTDQTSNSPTAKHRERDSLRRELSTLQSEVKELQQVREGLRAQLETLETQFLQQTEIRRTQLTAMRMENKRERDRQTDRQTDTERERERERETDRQTDRERERERDDLLLLSPHEEGLHQSLSVLEKYSSDWALPINMEKSKIMIFQKKPRLADKNMSYNWGNNS